MITHNGTYLLHATHHGMPIYAATMGGKMVIGGWLLSATLQAIVAAFGAEGTEVIAKTNDYLNRIATTDPQRALQLAGFINEDPLLVCSLVETSKTRWLVGDGKAKIYTGIISYDRIELDVVLTISLVNNNIFGYNYNKSGTQCRKSFGFNMSSLPTFGIGDGVIAYIQQSGGWSLNTLYHIEAEFLSNGSAKLWQNEVLKYSGSANRNNDIECCLMGLNQNNGLGSGGMIGKCNSGKFYENNMMIAHFIPMQRTDGTCGMLDIISGTFYPNANTAGAFTIQLTDKA